MFDTTVWTIISLIGIWYVPQIIAFELAHLRSFWNLLEEGYAALVMRNKVFHKVLLSFTGHKFVYGQSGEGYDIFDEYNIKKTTSKDAHSGTLKAYLLNILFPFRGIVWVGLPGVYTVDENKISVMQEVRELCLEEVLLEGGMSLKIQLSVTQQITNPAKAMLRIKSFLDSTNKYLEGWVRKEFSWLSVYDFVHKTAAGNEASSTRLVTAISTIQAFTENLKSTWGVTVHQIQVLNYSPADITTADLLTLLTKIRAEADAAIMKAGGAAEVTKIEANAEAAAMRATNEATKELSDNFMRLKELEVLRSADISMFNGLSVPPIPILPLRKGGAE